LRNQHSEELGALRILCAMHSTTLAALLLTTFSPAWPSALRQDEPKTEQKWTQGELEKISREIQSDLEQLRGEKFTSVVPVKVSSKADLIEYMKQQDAKTETPEKVDADATIAKLLGLIPPDLDVRAQMQALLESQVGGFYDPDSKSFSLMDSVPVSLAKTILSHELGHALDDQMFDIDGHYKKVADDTDAGHAVQAVVEGSGTAVMTQWTQEHMGSLDLSSISDSQMKELTAMGGAPMWMWKPLMASYMIGAPFLQRTNDLMASMRKPVNSADIRAAFENPPRSSEQILHPEKYWDAGKRDEPRKIAFDESKLESGWKVLREDTLGELSIAILATASSERTTRELSDPMAMVGMKFTNAVAEGWGGDRLVLLGNGDARLVQWVTLWDTERDAGEFYGAMTLLAPSFESAARALSGDKPKDSGATVEYGAAKDEVVITIRSRTTRSDLKRVLKSLSHTTSTEPGSNR
jgi:hypothetical protein